MDPAADLGSEITKEQLDYVVDHLKEIVAKLRSMSPLYEDYAKNICHKYLKRRKIMYSEKVMDHFQNPRNVGGEMENPSGVGTVGNAKCGDIMRMYLDIDENGIIKEAKFKTFGCGAAVATSSMATELVAGKTVQEALEVTNKAVMEGSGRTSTCKGSLFPFGRAGDPCSTLDYAQKNGIKIEGLEPPVNDIEELEEEEEY